MNEPTIPAWPQRSIDRIWQQGGRNEQVGQGKDGTWRVSELREVVKDQPVFQVPLAFLPLKEHEFDNSHGLVSFARHMKHVMECDLSYPIIFDEYGSILDGRHRIVKALIEGHTTIAAVRVPEGSKPTMDP